MQQSALFSSAFLLNVLQTDITTVRDRCESAVLKKDVGDPNICSMKIYIHLFTLFVYVLQLKHDRVFHCVRIFDCINVASGQLTRPLFFCEQFGVNKAAWMFRIIAVQSQICVAIIAI